MNHLHKGRSWRERFRDFYFNYKDAGLQVSTKRAAIEAFIDLLLKENLDQHLTAIKEDVEKAREYKLLFGANLVSSREMEKRESFIEGYQQGQQDMKDQVLSIIQREV